MADPISELLSIENSHGVPSTLISAYTTRLSTLSVSALTSTEPEALNHDAQSLSRSLQALAKRSYRSINVSAGAVEGVRGKLPEFAAASERLQTSLPILENRSSSFSQKYSKPTENAILERRRRATRLNESIERITDVLDLPTLLQSTIAASSGTSTSGTAQASTSAHASYASALDLYAHIKRLHKLYPDSPLVDSIITQAEEAMRGMTTKIIMTLRSQQLKLAGAIRLIGLLRRVAPELGESDDSGSSSWATTSDEGSLGALFLVCRLANLTATLDALQPLKELADEETNTRRSSVQLDERNAWAAGQQTERYLKRYIEVFREQCFAIVSMFKSIFPMSLQSPATGDGGDDDLESTVASLHSTIPADTKTAPHQDSLPFDSMQRLPSALSTFSVELVDTLMDTIRAYMPNVRDRSSRDSLLTQLLYCSSSLGRLGGDFSMMLSLMHEELEDATDSDQEPTNETQTEWIEAMKKHRIQAGRLESLASGAGVSKTQVSSGRELFSPA